MGTLLERVLKIEVNAKNGICDVYMMRRGKNSVATFVRCVNRGIFWDALSDFQVGV